MGHTNTLMEIGMKEIGISIYKMVSELITILMEIFIKENGPMESLMGKAIIFMLTIKVYTKETGKMVKNKGLENWLLMINMGTQGNGKRIKKMEKGLTYIQMDKGMKEVG